MAQENKLQLIDVNKFKILSYFKKGNENQKRFHREKKKNMQVKVSRNLFKRKSGSDDIEDKDEDASEKRKTSRNL